MAGGGITGVRGFKLYDVSTPNAPVEIASETMSWCVDLAFDGTRLYVTKDFSGVHAFNISDPTNPYPRDVYDVPDFPASLAIDFPYVYVSDPFDRLYIADFTQLNWAMHISGPLDDDIQATPAHRTMELVGSRLFLADGENGLQVIDVDDPANPLLLDVPPTNSYASAVRVIDGVAYVAGGGLRTYDVEACFACVGDLDRSGAIDLSDLLVVLSAWGPCPAYCSADLDDSGAVGLSDLLFMLSAWGQCPPQSSPPRGACCLPDFTCSNSATAANCAAADGVYQGDGTVCDAVVCP
jgi:hypothetical protein